MKASDKELTLWIHKKQKCWHPSQLLTGHQKWGHFEELVHSFPELLH
jgi:hypothetical protein